MNNSYPHLETLGIKLKKMRENKGFSQEDIAELLGVSQTTIGRYEQGKGCPNISQLNILAEHYSMDFNELLAGVFPFIQNNNGDIKGGVALNFGTIYHSQQETIANLLEQIEKLIRSLETKDALILKLLESQLPNDHP